MPANLAPHRPSILALETATELCSVALHHAGHTWQETLHAGQHHSEMLLPMVQRVLAQAGIALAGLDAIAFGAGPGSFTGLRIACGVAQGLAFAHDLPVLAVPSLEALALEAQGSILCAIDARMGEAYVAHYKVSTQIQSQTHSQIQTTCLQAAQVLKPQALIAQFDALSFDCLLGNAWQNLPELAAWAGTHTNVVRADCQPTAQQILMLALTQFAQGKAVPAEAASPLYVRNRIALTTAERLTGARL